MGSWWLETLGWVGSAILVWSLLQTQLRRLRTINLDSYLRHVLRVYEADIRPFNPEFMHDPFAGDPSFLVLKDDETVGVVFLCAVQGDTAQLLLDWVTPRYRDHSPGEFVFGPDGPFRRRGLRRVQTPPGMVEPYYERLGFRREGDAYVL